MKKIKNSQPQTNFTDSYKKEECKEGSSFSAYLDIIYGVPQESILGPVLFNIDLCALFFEDYSSNFADDTTAYKS